jgi:hypothetical protein
VLNGIELIRAWIMWFLALAKRQLAYVVGVIDRSVIGLDP